MNRPDHHWVTRLLRDLCASGYCLPPADCARLEAEPPGSIEAFTNAIFTAEGRTPELVPRNIWQGVRDRIALYFQAPTHPEIAQDIGPLLDALSELHVNIRASAYDGKHFGNYYVDLDASGTAFRIIRDRGQYIIEAQTDQLRTLGLFRAFNTREEIREAALKFVRAASEL